MIAAICIFIAFVTSAYYHRHCFCKQKLQIIVFVKLLATKLINVSKINFTINVSICSLLTLEYISKPISNEHLVSLILFIVFEYF